MDMIKIIAIALTTVMIVGILKQHRPEFATYASIFAGAILLLIILQQLSPIVSLLQNLSHQLGVNSQFFIILLKVTGIAYLSEIGANLCRDAGESAMASKVELAGKVFMIGLSIPIVTTLMETLLGFV